MKPNNLWYRCHIFTGLGERFWTRKWQLELFSLFYDRRCTAVEILLGLVVNKDNRGFCKKSSTSCCYLQLSWHQLIATAWMDGQLVGEYIRTEQLTMFGLQLPNSSEHSLGAPAAIGNGLLRPTALVQYSHTYRDGVLAVDAVCEMISSGRNQAQGQRAVLL